MRVKLKSFLFSSLTAFVVFSSCKKNKDVEAPTTPTDTVATVTAADKIKDTTLAYARDIYLWYDQIPASFNARSYADPDKIMMAIRQYSIEPGFSEPVDKWSFAVKQAEWDKVSSGIAGDFGLGVFFPSAQDLRVKMVEKSSPAGKAGIRRGWRITKINNNSNISSSNVNFVVEAVFYSPSTSFTFLTPEGKSVEITLNAASYQEHPIVFDSVYTTTAGKLGYLVFNSFLGDTTEIYNEFDRVFSKFVAAGVKEVAIDLRYNGGGYVSVQEKLANYLVKPSANGQVMMKQQFNKKYSQYNEVSTFTKLGSLNIDRLFFVVSKSTASASELLINNLKPYMNVLLVGPTPSYGKPVGFFPIPVGDWYIFPVSFRTTNKNNEGAYFGGFKLDKEVADGLDKDWGNVDESAFASILKYLNVGSFGTQSTAGAAQRPEVVSGNKALDAPAFKGTIDTRRFKDLR